MLVLEEVGRLLGQMREVAASMQEARDEHSRLAQAVAQISAAVRDMGEHNLHIKKKVRKMSKALRGGTHHRKVKDGLKSLQRDHQRILHAMSVNGINVTRVHNHNHTHNGTHKNNHHNHNRNHHNNNNNSTSSAGQSGKSSSSSSSSEEKNKKKKNKSSEGRHSEGGKEGGETPRNVSLESGATSSSSSSSSSSPGGESQETQVSQETTLPEAIVTDNLIPDLVVDPPGATDPPLPVDCTEVMQRGNWTSGSYMIQPRGLQQPIKVWCDHTTNGGGWTIMLARMEQETQENFDRNWTEYKNGFGEVTGEHWIGLDAMHSMIKGRNHELRVNITDWSDNEAWAEWKEFSVAGEEHFYRLKVNRYASGSQAGDALKWHNTMKFSTPDRDNDAIMGHNCAKKNHGGWWYRGYRGCYQAHPTGRFQRNPSPPPRTPANSRNFDLGPVLVWQNWRGEDYYPKALFLMFRPSLN
ncbi:angiopoietin-4-like [Macrobrachium nipponense]|uniref:angiopoietin-4-like n=1 Tax=Macrobrachium nipponense TaxID=159736 RepID=UPI0030C88EC1